jgi:hypothetical protein
MSVQNPIIPTPTAAQGIDAIIVDLQTHLSFELSWLTNGMGRAYKVKKVRTNGVTQFLPMVYLGTNKYNYFDASPDNDKQGQSIILVGDSSYINYQRGFYGVLEYPVSFIFSANLETINNTLLDTEIYTEHLINDVREALTRDLLGKPYNLVIDTDTQNFESVYSEFDIDTETGKTNKPLAPMVYFRFDTTIQIKESCPITPLNRCQAIIQNLTQDDIANCISPILCDPFTNLYRYDFDGVNEKLALPTNTAYNFQNTDSFSLECWIEADNTTHIGGLICKYGNAAAPSLRGWIFSLVNDKIRLSLQNNGGANGASVFSPVGSILPNTLYHVVATYNGNLDTNGIEIYINGVQKVKTIQFNNLTGDFDSTSDVSIGVVSNTGLYFDGKIDNVRIRNIILTPSQVLTAYNGGTAIAPIVGGLILDNRIGDGAIFGVNNWNDTDKSGTISGTQSVNMEFIDRVST